MVLNHTMQHHYLGKFEGVSKFHGPKGMVDPNVGPGGGRKQVKPPIQWGKTHNPSFLRCFRNMFFKVLNVFIFAALHVYNVNKHIPNSLVTPG